MLIDQIRLILLSFILCVVNAKGNVHDRCPRFKIKKATIIKTQQSIRDGAEFLGKTVVSSSRGCHEQCCKTGRRCNLVMLKYEVKEEVQKVSCFMFNCRSPSVCTFFQHSSYHRYAALEYESSFSNDYNKNSGFKDNHEVTTTTPETPQPTTTEETNWGHIKWFEADATAEPPKYIKPKYNSDSDDKNIDTPNNLVTTSRPNEDEDFPRRVFVDNNPDFPDEPHRNVMDQEAQVDKVSTTHHSYKMGDTKTKSIPKKTGHYGHHNSKFGTYDHAQTLKPDKGKKTVITKAPDKDETHGHDKKLPSKTKAKPKATRVKTTRAATRSRVSNVVIRRLNIQENKAVIPLAIGLVLALLLLMGVIFRLKTSRRRRTKAFLTDDADYLINGMYL